MKELTNGLIKTALLKIPIQLELFRGYTSIELYQQLNTSVEGLAETAAYPESSSRLKKPALKSPG